MPLQKHSPTSSTRRGFIKTAALAAPYIGWKTAAKGVGPNDTIHLASFGGGGRAGADIAGFSQVAGTKLVAFCDLDQRRAMKSLKSQPDAKFYDNWKEMLEKEADNFIGIGCGVPDHMHAPMAMSAMQLGKHVYVQKPMTRTLHEARALTEYAAANGIVTQMGNQLGSKRSNLTTVKILREGIIGKVREVHSMNPKKWGSMNHLPKRTDEIPEGFNWDAWLGVAKERPYLNGEYHPGNWRKRLDFGTGTLGDMACHIFHPWMKGLDAPVPVSVKSHGSGPVDRDSWPTDCRVVWKFKDGLTATWYDGDQFPSDAVQASVGGRENVPTSGSVIIGTEGALAVPHSGGALPTLYRDSLPVPDAYTPEEDSDHFSNWVDAIRGNVKKCVSGFHIAGPSTEVILLGTVAIRISGAKLEWDAAAGKFTNSDAANELVKQPYRKGWEVKGL